LAAELPSSLVVTAPGVPFLAEDRSQLEAAVEAARKADLAVIAVGDLAGMFGTGTSGEGCDCEDLSLPGLQGELVEAVLATGTPTVLLLVSGRPYALGAYASRCRAVVAAFMPGVEGAAAIAGVLSGRLNPSGHLPVAIRTAQAVSPARTSQRRSAGSPRACPTSTRALCFPSATVSRTRPSHVRTS